MSRHSSFVRALLVMGLVASSSSSVALAVTPPTGRTPSATKSAQVTQHYGNLPLSFEANQGQADASAQFLARGSGYSLDLTGNGAMLALCQPARPPATCNAVHMELAGVSSAKKPSGEGQLPGTVNYFIGNDPAKWRTGIPTYARVRYRNLYPGIDLVYYGNQRQLEYDFELAPGADAKLIQMRLDGVSQVRRAANGDLVASTPGGALTLRRPQIYQLEDGRRVPVRGEFALEVKHTVRFRLGRYDRSKPLVIDPVLVYSTFVGGNGTDTAYAIAVDTSGEAYIAGSTSSTNFPVTPGAFQTQDKAAANQSLTGFVAKLNAAGTALVYATYLGGSGASSTIASDTDSIRAIALDSAGDAYLTGTAGSTDFPVTQGAFQTTNKAAANQVPTSFVTELNPTGTALIYSTYLGGSGSPLCTENCSGYPGGDTGYGISVDTAGEAFVTGQTYSTDFPVTSGAFQTTNHAAAAKEFNAFITKMNATGTALVYSTYLGGAGAAGAGDSSAAIVVDSGGDAYLAGEATSTDFPVTSGAFQTTLHPSGSTYTYSDAFVSELNPTGTALIYSTFLGGSSGDSASGVVIDTSGSAYVTGTTSSADFPVTSGAFQTVDNCSFNSSPGPNAFITKLNPSGSALVYSTYLGGSGGIINLSPTLFAAGGDEATGIAIDGAGNAYVTGRTASANFPVTPGAFQTTNNDQTADSIGGYNAFATELNPSGTALVYSTYLGGNGIDPGDFTGLLVFGEGDQAYALALDSANNVYVTGDANSEDFPVTSGAPQPSMQSKQNAFVTKLELSAGTATTVSPTITITPSPAQATSAQAITVTVTASGPSGDSTPTGTVTMSAGGYGPMQATLSGGSATFNIAAGTLPAYSCYNQIPPYTIPANLAEANYIPDSSSSSQYNFVSGTSAIYDAGPCFIFNAPAAITPAQAAQPLSVPIVSSTYTGLRLPTGNLTLSVGNYTSASTALAGGNVAAAITSSPSGAVNLPALSFGSTSPVSITGTNAATATLTITTTARSGCESVVRSEKVPWYAPGSAALAAILLIAVPRRRRWNAWLPLVLLAGMTAGGVSACGSGSGTGCTSNGGTTAGTYVITITGTGGGSTATGPVTLTVQ